MSLKVVVAKGHDLNCGYETPEELLCIYICIPHLKGFLLTGAQFIRSTKVSDTSFSIAVFT